MPRSCQWELWLTWRMIIMRIVGNRVTQFVVSILSSRCFVQLENQDNIFEQNGNAYDNDPKLLFNDRTSWCLIFPLACKCLKFIDPHFFSSQREENRFSRTWNNLETCHFGLLGLHFCGGVDYKIFILFWEEAYLGKSYEHPGWHRVWVVKIKKAIRGSRRRWDRSFYCYMRERLKLGIAGIRHHHTYTIWTFPSHESHVHYHCDISCSFWKVFFCNPAGSHHQCIVYRLPYMTPNGWICISLPLLWLKLQSTSPQGERTKSH